ncbi:MAG: cytochrome c family protein [Alphaproteobacteria bacterium]|nr:cytochrome c family protein [Alphaproteobacteria bacterium]MCB9931030.1 cytochrome c family protein [Alphaproteobacteria bacterium]
MAQTNWDRSKMVGPDKCGECHKTSVEVWRGTHHFSTFTNMPRSKEARDIANAMGIKRIKADSLCLDCHFTTVKNQPVAGISCESCHSPGRDWIKVHSGYSGKKKETESKQEAADRWAKSVRAGMIRPGNTYAIAKNCYNCHVVPQEKLVNQGGHPAGSPFELVSWSQGEVRHNVWWNNGNGNPVANANRKRMLFIIGQAVELETALRAVGKATAKDKYAVAMAQRAQNAAKRFAAIAGKVSTPETKAIVAALGGVKLSLNNGAQLNAAANKVATQAKALSAKYDGSKFAALDPFIPGPNAYKGKPAR